MDDNELDSVLTGVGARLKDLRRRQGTTLTELAETTGISLSTLSRLESGKRKPTLELLLPIAAAHRVQLDDLVGAPTTGDPRVHMRPFQRHGQTFIPLTQGFAGLQAYKQIRPPDGPDKPAQRTHEGYEWLYILSGKLRLALGSHDLTLGPGEAAEFDTRVPHGFSNPGTEPVEFLAIFGPQGEKIHVKARPKTT
ncbi:helix-turn-helix domain-containing protein [Glycomyces buryatensis]|uniref:Helix-turn-helix domain-containing protein n=1 Tax=Glycomyces buryatensis TaxID=2570927 RepID=A0A4V4HQD7_9ACTN|nr:XRE family transcriptional regulator [Glycomyces buryatensis]THV33456.1 helix-turn-helix domain-containing protein [Glycomyces buryatensis]